jgi:hypothetical protein
MSSFQWRNNPIGPIKGADSRSPTLADFRRWTGDAFRSMRAVGAGYIIGLLDIIKLDKDGKYPRLVDATKDDVYGSTEFCARIVQLADQHGKIFADANPASTPSLKKNFQLVSDDVQSFGAQIARAAPEDKRNVFNQPEIQDFPLFPLLEWHMLGDSFDPHRDTDSTDYWQALTDALAPPLDLTNSGMQAWITRISNARTDLAKIEPILTVDSSIIGPVINKFVNLDDNINGVNKWQIKANAWHDAYLTDKKSMTWMRLKQSILQLLTSSQKHKADDSTDDHATSHHKRPKLNPTSPAQISMIAEHSDMHTIAYNAAFQAFTDAQIAKPHVICDVCGGRGHIKYHCPSDPRVAAGTDGGRPRISAPGGGGPPPQRYSRWDRGGGRGGSGGYRGGYQGGMGRGPGGGGGYGRGASGYGRGGGDGNTGRGGGFRGTFRGGAQGRGISSRALADVVTEAALAAISQAQAYAHTQFDDPEAEYEGYDHYPPPDEFPNPSPNPDLALAAHTHTPGAQVPDDRSAAFRHTVFGHD